MCLCSYRKCLISQFPTSFGGTPIVKQNRCSWTCNLAGPALNFAFGGLEDIWMRYCSSATCRHKNQTYSYSGMKFFLLFTKYIRRTRIKKMLRINVNTHLYTFTYLLLNAYKFSPATVWAAPLYRMLTQRSNLGKWWPQCSILYPKWILQTNFPRWKKILSSIKSNSPKKKKKTVPRIHRAIAFNFTCF